MVERRLTAFHKLMVFAVIAQVLSVLCSAYALGLLKRACELPTLASWAGGFLVMILVLFVAGCMRARARRDLKTVGYLPAILIPFVSCIFTMKAISIFVGIPAILAIGLTRRYWQVPQGPPVRGEMRSWNVYHRLIVVMYLLLVIIPLFVAYSGGNGSFNYAWLGAFHTSIPYLILVFFFAGCIKAKLYGEGSTIDAPFFFFVLLICALFSFIVGGGGYWFLFAAIAVVLTRRLWEVKPMDRSKRQGPAKAPNGHDPQEEEGG